MPSKLRAMAMGLAHPYTHGKVMNFMCILEDFWLDKSLCDKLIVKVI